MNQKAEKIGSHWSVFGIICLTFLLFCWLKCIFVDQQKRIYIESFVLFKQMLQIEKELQIKRQLGYYDHNDSFNDISSEEKDEWCIQDYLTWRDPNRTLLDSLFQASLIEKGIQAQSAIRYIHSGDTINTCPDSLFYKEAYALPPMIYRIDTNKDNNITLQAYVKLPFTTVLTRSPLIIPVFCLWLISLAGIIGVYYYIMNRKKVIAPALAPTPTPIPIPAPAPPSDPVPDPVPVPDPIPDPVPAPTTTIQESIVPLVQEPTIIWTQLAPDLLFDDKYGDLQYKGEVCARLNGNSLKLFRCFIASRQLSYEDICIDILGRLIKDGRSKYDRDAVSSTVYRLRDSLASIPVIKIITIRNVGYEMIFLDN